MPFVYSHLSFGKKCLDLLPDEYKNIINNNILFYNYGTQGPNILYYHSPFSSKKYIDLANNIHSNQIAITLKRMKEIFLNSKNRDAILAYCLGYISHFLLDSYCNNYLAKSSVELKISTNQIKKEIERYYLYKDKINKPHAILNDLKLDNNINKLIAKLMNISEKDIKQSISNFITYSNILMINNKYLLVVIFKILSIIKRSDYIDIFLYGNPNKHTAQIIRIEKYFQIAAIHYKLLVNNFLNYVFLDKDLDKYFLNSFNNENNQIDVLKIDDEKNYIIKEFMK